MPSTARGVGNLPPELTTFVGRRREVSEVRQLLASSHLATLTGPGGVGKTRLALRVARKVRRAFVDGVWLVELDRLQDSELLAETVTVALGLRDPFEGPPGAVLERYLVPRQLLLVLDNCEHLVDAVAKLVATLLRSCPGLRVLATSREPLGIYGEATLTVPSLPVPNEQLPASPQEMTRFEAVALFVDRANAGTPGFALTSSNQAAVAEICSRLDGLPLAIELAAARLRVLSVHEIADRLRNEFRLLGGGPRGAPTRQQTLLACIEWSYDLCSTLDRLLWARLAVFAGPFELDAAEAVGGADDLPTDDVLALLASLVDKSIVIREGDAKIARYRLLDSIRDFGREKLSETGELRTLCQRHRDWYADLIGQADTDWISPRQRDWLTRLDREQPNIRAAMEYSLSAPSDVQTALRMAAAVYPYCLARGRLNEGRRWVGQALDLPAELSSDRIRALYAATMLAWHQGDLPGQSAWMDEAAESARRLGDPSMSAMVDLASGYLALRTGDLDRGPKLLADVVEGFRAELDLPRLLEALFALSLMSLQREDTTRALACLREMLTITESRNEAWFRSLAEWSLGLTTWRQGDTRQALDLVRGSLRLKRSIDDLLGTAWCLEALAWMSATEHDHQRAAKLLGSAKELWEAIGMSPATGGKPVERFHDECRRQTRDELGEQAFEEALREGSRMPLPAALAYALGEPVRATPGSVATEAILTPREQEVADLIARGATNKDIAARLVISRRTAETHVENILVKLGFTSRSQVAAWVGKVDEQGGDTR